MWSKRGSIILTTPVFLSHCEVLPSIATVCHSRCSLYQSVHILDEYLRFCCHLVRNSYHSILTHIELLNTVLMESLIISFANFHLILPLKCIEQLSHWETRFINFLWWNKYIACTMSLFGGISILLVL